MEWVSFVKFGSIESRDTATHGEESSVVGVVAVHEVGVRLLGIEGRVCHDLPALVLVDGVGAVGDERGNNLVDDKLGRNFSLHADRELFHFVGGNLVLLPETDRPVDVVAGEVRSLAKNLGDP